MVATSNKIFITHKNQQVRIARLLLVIFLFSSSICNYFDLESDPNRTENVDQKHAFLLCVLFLGKFENPGNTQGNVKIVQS